MYANNIIYVKLKLKLMIMKTKKSSGTLVNLKFLLILPVIAAVMVAFTSCGKNKNTEAALTEFVPPPPPPPPPIDSSSVNYGDSAWITVDEMPIFNGGNAALLNFITQNTKYPDAAKTNGIQGKVIVRFIVTDKCAVTNASILKSVSPELDAESLRVIKSLPDFKRPGRQKGVPVHVWYTVPISFKLK